MVKIHYRFKEYAKVHGEWWICPLGATAYRIISKYDQFNDKELDKELRRLKICRILK